MPLHNIDNNILVTLSQVSFSYEHTPVLQDVDLVVREHDFIVITGANGGGKTTLLKLLLRLLKPSKGLVEYHVNGEHAQSFSVGYLPQKNAIDSHFPITVEEIVQSGLYAEKSLDKQEQKLRVRAVLEELQLLHLAHRTIGELSGGQLQRTLLGRAIVSQPRLLVLDEPLSYIDEAFIPHIYTILRRMMSHSAIVMVTHQPASVQSLATQVYTVDDRRLL